MKTRIYFLDNLRTFLIFLVVMLHSGLVYERVLESNWLVIDPVKNDSIGLVRLYLDIFVMFIIFFISGYFIPNSLKRNDAWGFLKSKFKRIMVPWIVAVFTLIPAYKIIFLFSRGLPQEEWFSYFHFFERAGSDLSIFSNNLSQNWLWFLPVLFLFQVTYLSLSKLNLLSFNISLKGAVILVFTLGLIYSFTISFIGLKGWTLTTLLDFQRERLVVYFMVFLLGSLCNKLKVFETTSRNNKYYIISNVLLTISLTFFTIIALNLFFNIIDPNRNYYFVSEHIDRLGYYSTLLLSMFSFLYIFIHAFRFSFNKEYSIMRELNLNSYEVYIIHMIVMGVFALILVYIPIPAFVKYLILTILTFIISNILISVYKRIFQQNLSLKMVGLIVVLATLFGFISFLPQAQISRSQAGIAPSKIGLHTAALQGDIDAIRQHIKAGSDLNEKDPAGGGSPLCTAAAFGKTEVALALIDAGADVNFKNNDGATPLHNAAFFCHTEIVEALLDKGADATKKNNSGATAIETVAYSFDEVEGVYDYCKAAFGPLGMELEYEYLKKTRPKIVEMLRNYSSE